MKLFERQPLNIFACLTWEELIGKLHQEIGCKGCDYKDYAYYSDPHCEAPDDCYFKIQSRIFDLLIRDEEALRDLNLTIEIRQLLDEPWKG